MPLLDLSQEGPVAKSVILQFFSDIAARSFSTLAEFDALLIPDDVPSPEAIAAGRQELGRLAETIERLPPECREAFVLRKVRRLSQREAAEAMNVSENTIEKHIGKALHLRGSTIGRGGNRPATASDSHEAIQADETEQVTRDRL